MGDKLKCNNQFSKSEQKSLDMNRDIVQIYNLLCMYNLLCILLNYLKSFTCTLKLLLDSPVSVPVLRVT